LGERERFVQKEFFFLHPELVPLGVFSIRRPDPPLVNPEGMLRDWTWMLVVVTVPKTIPEGTSIAV
jgi:hypothetical protein